MRVSSTTQAPPDTGADTIAVGVFEGERIAHDVDGVLQGLVDSGEARAGLRKLAVAHAGGNRYVLVGLGKRDEFDAERARVAAAAVAGRARELGTKRLCWEIPHHVDAPGFVEGTVLAAYEYREFSTDPDDGPRLEELIVSAHHDTSAEVDRAAAAAEAANACRDLQNAPANEMTPRALAERARALPGLQVEVWGRAEIEAAGMGAFAAVAQGTHEEPQLITLRYEPPDVAGPLLGFVGKGVTFDSGGISIKPGAEDERDEVRHVGRRRRARGDRGDRPARAPGPRGDGDRRDREPAQRPRGQARRHPARQDRHHDRGHQHRRRGPARARRLPRPRDRPGRRAARRPRHADRRDRHHFRLDLRGPVRLGRRLVRRDRGGRRAEPASWSGGCRCTPSTPS